MNTFVIVNFVTKGHLKEHIDGVHDHTTVSNCPVCGKTFNTEKRMRKHLFNTHKDVAEEYRKHGLAIPVRFLKALQQASIRAGVMWCSMAICASAASARTAATATTTRPKKPSPTNPSPATGR